MYKVRFRVDSDGSGNAKVVRDLTGTLQNAKFELVDSDCGGNADKEASPFPGIFLIGRQPGSGDTPGIYESVAEFSRSGSVPTIVLLIDPEAPNCERICRLMCSGASDVICKPSFANACDDVIRKLKRWVEIDEILSSPLIEKNIIGKSGTWVTAMRKVIEAAAFSSSSILIMGESGTGKELIARLIHALDSRTDKRDLIVLDCTTVVPELSGSEFFGHERGSFTSAVGSRVGAFAQADGGTLLLDEIGELPLRLQAELLRVIQEGTYKRIGSDIWRNTKFRLVCATNKDLSTELQRGRFRSDLYFRLAASICRLPPLRDRRDDIELLARHFLMQYCDSDEVPDFDRVVCDYLRARDYPGNVRELRNLVSAMAERCSGAGTITVGDIPPGFLGHHYRDLERTSEQELCEAICRAVDRGMTLKSIVKRARDAAINRAVEIEGSNVSAASRLDVSARTIQYYSPKKIADG